VNKEALEGNQALDSLLKLKDLYYSIKKEYEARLSASYKGNIGQGMISKMITENTCPTMEERVIAVERIIK
jgi:hypothetical protein